jgi:glucose/arabinose dehydrogenase
MAVAFPTSFILCFFLIATALAQAAAPPSKPNVQVEMLARGLETPWAIAFAPDGRIFITERPGRIRVIKNGALQKEPWMQIEVYQSGEAGLLGLALDPAFERNRFIYAAHTYRDDKGKIKNRLVRLRDETGKGVFDKVLLDNVEGADNHDGGRVKFGPDGKLYWTTGDAQTARFAQNLSSLNGKILRLNPDGTIPPENPFPKSPVYSYGHRNSEGLAWQPGSVQLYATEHGPSGFQGCCLDEINLIEPGKNYGWPEIRGDEKRDGMISPVLHSGTSDTWAPAGATFVTPGPRSGEWTGTLLFTGLRGQTLYRAAIDANDPRKATIVERLFAREFGRLRDVAEGPDGAIYILTSNRDGRGRPSADDDRVLRLVFR